LKHARNIRIIENGEWMVCEVLTISGAWREDRICLKEGLGFEKDEIKLIAKPTSGLYITFNDSVSSSVHTELLISTKIFSASGCLRRATSSTSGKTLPPCYGISVSSTTASKIATSQGSTIDLREFLEHHRGKVTFSMKKSE